MQLYLEVRKETRSFCLLEMFGALYRWQILDSFLVSIKGFLEAQSPLDIKGCYFIFHSRTDVESLNRAVRLGGLQVMGGDCPLQGWQDLCSLHGSCAMLFPSHCSAILTLRGCLMGSFLRVSCS